MMKGQWIIIALVIFTGCIQPISFDIASTERLLIIEGRITDEAPPYQVKVSYALDLEADTLKGLPETNAIVTLYDGKGINETFVEIHPGVYESSGIIAGKAGSSYQLTVQTTDGKLFESASEVLKSSGHVTAIRFEFEERDKLVSYGEANADVFNIYIDAAGHGTEDLIRWKMTGIYRVLTYPALRMTEVPPYTPYKDPVPCSGYIVVGGPPGSGGLLEQIGPCTCCDCWAYQYPDIPVLNDEFEVVDAQYQNIKVGEVPITNYTFHDKYMVVIEQMSLSETAFRFFKEVQKQKLASTDLFQPQVGSLMGNVFPADPNDRVLGLFYAAGIQKNHQYISRESIPYPVTPITFITEACYDSYDNATNEKPILWEE